tara:strand:- start:5854 stop:6387 length:534 start_codon:yes stop_codon:yes gene_type:complete
MSAINGFTPLGPGAPSTESSGFNQMSSEDFIRVIFTELANQDPLSPSDSSELLDQMNSIRSIESDLQMMNKLESLVFENQLSSASSMIGNFVGGLTPEGMRVGGHVLSVVRQGGEVALELDSGWFLPLDGVETIIDPTLLVGDADEADAEVEADAEDGADGEEPTEDAGDEGGDDEG